MNNCIYNVPVCNAHTRSRNLESGAGSDNFNYALFKSF